VACSEKILAPSRVLVISPHLDDAVISVGATIAHRTLRGLTTEVATVFAGANPDRLSRAARAFHRDCGLGANAVAVRKKEDAEALAALGASSKHLRYLDAIYRAAPNGRRLARHRQHMFKTSVSEEEHLVTDIAETLADLATRFEPEVVLTCAGFGSHIDHVVTRAATQRWTRRERRPLLLWEDLPYMVNEPISGKVPGCPVRSSPPAKAWELKWQAVRSYESQIRMLWRGGRDWRAELTQHAKIRGCGIPSEQFWLADVHDPPRE
jgi:LmbE family N-acetylglucosaminyl deacetylase